MIIEKDEIRGIWIVFKTEKSAKLEMFNSKLKKEIVKILLKGWDLCI